MQRFKTIWKGQKIVRKHLSLPEPVFNQFEAEAEQSHGGNFSLLLERILSARYKIKPTTKESSYT